MRKLPLKTKDLAGRIIKNFCRYRYSSMTDKSTWDQSGPFTPNSLIPPCTKTQHAEADRIMRRGHPVGTRITTVDPRRLKSFQRHLRVGSLLWNLKNFEAMQERFRDPDVDTAAVNLPKVVRLADGTLVVWNGNHRATVGLLVNADRLMVQVFVARRRR